MSWTLVTGGAKRLGAEICRTLARQGHDVAIHYRRSKQEAEKTAATCREYGVKAHVIQGDFSTLASTQTFAMECMQELQGIKNLINNVGNYYVGSALQTPLAQWETIFQNNLHVPFFLTQLFADSLQKNKGSIINIGVAGINGIRADRYATSYTCAKTGLWMLTRSLAAELAPHGVKVNMVSPGYLEDAVDLPQDTTKIPMGRPAQAQEIAKVIAFLLGDDANYITGQNIEVAGGVRL